MAAEMAFSEPPAPGTPSIQPLVIVRRSRVVSPASGLATSTAAAIEGTTLAPSAATAAKAPRVFLVESQEQPMPAPAPIGDAQVHGLSDHQSGDEPSHARPQHRRRRRQDTRPGAVVHVVPSPLARVMAAASKPRAHVPALVLGARDLTVKLASLEAIFDAIRHAAAFRITHDDVAYEWVSLSARIAKLRLSLRQLQS